MTIDIRDATDADADQGCEVMQRSIRELCIADHQGRPDVLARWLCNKNPDVFRNWITQPGNSLWLPLKKERSSPSAPSRTAAKSP